MVIATEIDNQKPLLQRLAEFLTPAEYDTTYLTHGLHPYPAKYIPQLPRAIIIEHTNERSTILDPFCGSGTTLLEACVLGRKSIGVDSNPIATLISRVKTRTLSNEEIKLTNNFLLSVSDVLTEKKLPDIAPPEIPSIEHWFQDNVARELAWLKSQIDKIDSVHVRDFLLCVFSSIIVSVSNQESDTRYAAIDKELPDRFTIKRFVKKLSGSIEQVKLLSAIDPARRNPPAVLTLDARNITSKQIGDNSIDLVVTSPPYPNSYDYYLYHKLRMFWLGYKPRDVQHAEIGSRHEHSSKKASIETFEEKMIEVLRNVARVLKPSKLAYFFIGDAIIAGKYIDMSEVFRNIGERAGLGFIADTEYSLDIVSRSFHEKRWSSNKNQRKKMQRVLVFEGVTAKSQVSLSGRHIASPIASLKQVTLDGDVPNGITIAIRSEGSKRHIHSLGKYPSKFFPEIPRWAIKQFSKPGDTVLDPFVGSGTTAVESILLSRNAISADFSPYACLLSEAKTTRVKVSELDAYVKAFSELLDSPNKLPNRERLSFELDTFWFKPEHLTEFEQLRSYIVQEIPISMRSFFLAVLSTTIKTFSFLDSGQIKVKRDAKKVLSGTPSPFFLMKDRLITYVTRLKQFIELANPIVNHQIISASAADLPDYIRSNEVDLVVTSPPYINAMNYLMTHRYENLLLRLITESELKSHQSGYFGSERVYARDYSKLNLVPQSYSIAEYLNPRLEQIFAKEPKRSYIAYQYMMDMYHAFKGIASLLKAGGRLVLVAGSNVIRGTHIDTFEVLVQMLVEHGLKLHSSFHYEIIKNAFKLRRHETSNLIKLDGVAILEKL